MTKELKIMLGIAVLVIAGAAFLFIKGNPQSTTPADAGLLVRDNSDMTGDKNAKVTLVEFGDFQCPFCASMSPILKQIIDNYQGNKDFNFVFRNFPLPQHQYAKISAEAAEAAGAQGKYWEMNELIYANQNVWVPSPTPLDIYAGYAQTLGLNVDQFRSDVQANKFSDKINTDLADGNALGVNSTPTLYLNGVKTPASNFTDLKSAIDAALAK